MIIIKYGNEKFDREDEEKRDSVLDGEPLDEQNMPTPTPGRYGEGKEGEDDSM